MNKLSNLVKEVIAEEEAILIELDVENRLCEVVTKSEGLKQFARLFYFVRCDFPTLNFIVGERCGTNEFLWSGLARNLIEELGDGKAPSHNQLYRNFMDCVGASTKDLVDEPLFSSKFNENWRKFCRESPLEEALSAIAVYEIFDQPDYKLFLRAMQKAGVPEAGLDFFKSMQ
ncbi:MAG: iron-containing redox enzyme family protein [Hydrococcus sp. RM1_1_31]|nr:iron-containing redox enzyme family protein [Hydrococcus sp. RM1_1_31]